MGKTLNIPVFFKGIQAVFSLGSMQLYRIVEFRGAQLLPQLFSLANSLPKIQKHK
jgi:hypothetical protein